MFWYLFNNPEAYPDFTVVCEAKQWLLHRGFLTRIPYFKQLFQLDANCKDVEIKNYPSCVVDAILKWVYSLASPSLTWQQHIQAYRLADEWHLDDYKKNILKILLTAITDQNHSLKIWNFVKTIDDEETKKLFLANFWSNHTKIPSDRDLCKEVLAYLQAEEGNHPNIISFLTQCYRRSIFTKEEVNSYLCNITPLEDHHFINYDIKGSQQELSPSYLDTLIATYFVNLTYPDETRCKKCTYDDGKLRLVFLCDSHLEDYSSDSD